MRRILFIKLGAIGDVIQAAAAVAELKQQEPHTQVDWIIGSSIEPLLEDLKFIDRRIAISDQILYQGPLLKRILTLAKGLFSIYQSAQRYDAIYIGHSSRQYLLFAIPAILKNLPRRLLAINIFHPILKQNRVSSYFDFLTSNIKAFHHSDSDALMKLGQSLLSEMTPSQYIQDRKGKYVVLAPGGSKNLLRDDMLRRWPVERYAQLAKKIIKDGYSVVLVGSKDDAWVLPFFQDIDVLNLIGKTSLKQLLPIFDACQLIVTHDTGPLHMATLTKTPILALFGPTYATAVVPLERVSLSALEAIGSVACAPCYDGKNYANCHDPICMKSHSVEHVFASAKGLLQ